MAFPKWTVDRRSWLIRMKLQQRTMLVLVLVLKVEFGFILTGVTS